MSMRLVQTIVVGSGAGSDAVFTNIPQNGRDLLIVVSARSSTTGTTRMRLQMNSQTSGYSSRVLEGDGSSRYSFSESNNNAFPGGIVPTSSQTSNTFSNHLYYFPNYADSVNKSVSIDAVSENNGTTAQQTLVAGNSTITSAITQVLFFLEGGNLVQNSTFSLYTIG